MPQQALAGCAESKVAAPKRLESQQQRRLQPSPDGVHNLDFHHIVLAICHPMDGQPRRACGGGGGGKRTGPWAQRRFLASLRLIRRASRRSAGRASTLQQAAWSCVLAQAARPATHAGARYGVPRRRQLGARAAAPAPVTSPASSRPSCSSSCVTSLAMSLASCTPPEPSAATWERGWGHTASGLRREPCSGGDSIAGLQAAHRPAAQGRCHVVSTVCCATARAQHAIVPPRRRRLNAALPPARVAAAAVLTTSASSSTVARLLAMLPACRRGARRGPSACKSAAQEARAADWDPACASR